MYRVFNMGIGMTIVCSSDKLGRITKTLPEAKIIGEIAKAQSEERTTVS
jgi:phosphoribosylaminoimidazole (AIR) synthetase